MRTALLIISVIIGINAIAQNSEKMTRLAYFETYKDIAILEMHRSGVPASITLAQGALESGDGNSRLARIGNNHFGIKCHNDWDGKKIFEDDDAKNECFRHYKTVEDSYKDHSDYLRSKSRYDFLFQLDITDYKGWAKGLKKAGYATSPTYSSALIKIIEDYNLNLLDRMDKPERGRKKAVVAANPNLSSSRREIMEKNRVKYIVARPGDTYEAITNEFGKLSWEITEYNDIVNPDSIVAGQVIYIQPKRNKAQMGHETHVVKERETMYTISQFYAIKLSRLYTMNNLNPGTKISVGTVLNLRKPVKRSIPKPVLTTDPVDQDEEEIKIDIIE